MSKKALLGGLLPFITNPVVLAVAGAGAVALTVYEMLSDKDEVQENGSEAVTDGSTPLIEPWDDEVLAVEPTVIDPLETVELAAGETVNPIVEKPHPTTDSDCSDTNPDEDKPTKDEVATKEMIRQAMSELGKRSAAARAKKKQIK